MTSKIYDFSKGKRGPVRKPAPGKTRITIRIDDDILDWFRSKADEAGGGNYQTMINDALRSVVERERDRRSEGARKVAVREELDRLLSSRLDVALSAASLEAATRLAQEVERVLAQRMETSFNEVLQALTGAEAREAVLRERQQRLSAGERTAPRGAEEIPRP